MKVNENKIYNPEIECMDRKDILDIQSQRLKETVAHVYKNVSMYRQRMDEAGVKPEDIKSVDDLHLLPFTNKTDLRDEFPYGLLAVDKSEIVRIQGSSGTTGKPIVSGYTQNDVDVWTEMVARSLTAAGAGKDDIVQVTYGYGLFTGGLGAHQGASAVGATVIPMSSGNTQRQLMMMHDLGATMLCCTPSYAIFLGESLKELGYDPKEFKLKSGCFGAEPWTEEMREKLEGLFDINAYNIYGLTEIAGPGVAFECPSKCGMHVNEDHVIAEIVDPKTGEVLPYGETGELVFTTLTKEGLPLIRYRTKDLTSITREKCECGRTSSRISKFKGRSDDMLIIRGVNVFPSQVEAALVEVEEVTPHYLIVVDRVNNLDTMEIQVELNSNYYTDEIKGIERITKKIGHVIMQALGLNAKITIAQPGSLKRSEGKAVHVVDKRKYE